MIYKIAAHSDEGIVKKTNQDSVLVKIAQTNHEELLVSCPLYKEMWDAHISVKDTVKEGE